MRTNYWISLLTLTACGVDAPNGDDASLEVLDGGHEGGRRAWQLGRQFKQERRATRASGRRRRHEWRRPARFRDRRARPRQGLHLPRIRGRMPTRPDATITGPFMFGWDIVRIPRDGGDCFASTSSREPYVSVYCGLAATPAWRSTGVVGAPTPDNDWNMAAGDYNGDGDTNLVISESEARAACGRSTAAERASCAARLPGRSKASASSAASATASRSRTSMMRVR